MKKLNILKSIIDFVWIVSLPIIPIILLFIPFLLISDSLNELPFKLNGEEVFTTDIYSKIIIVLIMLSYLILLYCLYLFRKVLRHFQRLKIFDDFVYIKLNKIGSLLVIVAFVSGLPSFLYKVIYQKKIMLDLGFSPFILLISSGLFFMVLSEVFKIANLAKQDSELTI